MTNLCNSFHCHAVRCNRVCFAVYLWMYKETKLKQKKQLQKHSMNNEVIITTIISNVPSKPWGSMAVHKKENFKS